MEAELGPHARCPQPGPGAPRGDEAGALQAAPGAAGGGGGVVVGVPAPRPESERAVKCSRRT